MKKKIALTGGPNSGKTTALSVLKETFGPRVELVKEAATMIFSGGFPRKDGSPEHVRTAQRIIFFATRQMESLAEESSDAELIVCDRGTVDAAVYWPEGVEDFFKHMGTTLDAELARYDAVLHLSPPTNPAFYQSTHVRTESLDEAFAIDRKILKIWENHPNRLVVDGKEHFIEKAEIIKNFVEKLIQK
ncbi:AAA family ATPase [Candidatus Avelusimicrobium faecicola]|uniref:ATP/GTP-binding protein n=1 Tax=Candidatus Avelusimicrobium faecicola TaxID=3416205 RepID=UPI0015A192D6|nr:ATP-binding protein [Spirochaetota bacterium]MDE3276971.1 ATP-binding protein [Spirochaetota bacterium]MDY2939722.1 ATP-binding protein [Elusimicrobiaceae bacterium]MDY6129198.1 ATP-binding protein [Elusimicrobiaceae bacterium]